MFLVLLALVIILALFGAGFAAHLMWWLALAALVVFLISLISRRYTGR
jgi:hypothetical protein